MIYKKLRYLPLLCLVSCNEPARQAGEQAAVPDPVAANEPQVSAKFSTQNNLPFTADTTLFLHLESCDSLGTNEVKALSGYWHVNDLVSNVTWQLEGFYKIDSIKAAGQYASYCDSLDIGQTKRSNAYAVCRLQTDSNVSVLVWALTASSYEACPYSSSQCVFFTLVKNGQIGESFLLGEHVAAGDPPVSMERLVQGRINKDLSVELDVFEEQDEDMDLPEVLITREKHVLAIRNGRLVKVSERKDPPRKEKRRVNS